MKPILFPFTALSFAATLCGCVATGPAPSAATSATGGRGIEVSDLNKSADACGDFYEYANGAWRAQNPAPAGKARWSRRIAAQDANMQRVLAVLEAVSQQKNAGAGSTEQVLGDYYAACMNEGAADASGVQAVAPLLAEIDAVRDAAGVQRAVRRLHERAITVAFALSSTPDYHEPFRTIGNIAAGTLGLPDRDYYLKDEPRFVEARAKYLVQVADVLILGGMAAPQAAEAAGNIFALEKRLAEASLDSAAADLVKTDHKMSFAQLVELAPHVDWARYFDEAKLPRDALNIAEPNYLKQLDRELVATSPAVWAAYLKWQLLDSASPFLSKPFAEAGFRFHDQYLNKVSAMKPRAQFCAESTESLLGDALGKKYAERYFSAAAKAKGFEIARNLMAALKEDAATVPWMQAGARQIALAKLADTDLQVGYPDHWKDYSSLTVRRDTFWANVAAARQYGVEEDRALIGKPTDRTAWALAPSSAGAYIDLQLNKVVLPAGFMQPPYFSLEVNDAVNYGAMGIALAHDFTHAVDSTGSETDVQGHPTPWWSTADRNAFEQRAQCMVDQYEGYFIEPGAHLNGKLVRSETIGDQGGVRIAWLALQKAMQAHPIPVVDGFTPEQQFFIAWGQSTGAAMSLEAQRTWIKGDPHPTPKFRVNGPLSNAPEFQQAFSCKADAAMVRPPEKRCAIW